MHCHISTNHTRRKILYYLTRLELLNIRVLHPNVNTLSFLKKLFQILYIFDATIVIHLFF